MSVQLPDKRQLGAQLIDLLETMSDAFIALDRDWRYTYVNANACRIIGRQRDAIIGRSIWEVLPELLTLPFHAACQRALREQEFVALEGYYPHYGTWLEDRIYPTPDGLTILFTDISERKRAEHELRLREKALHSSSDGIVIMDAASPDLPVIYMNAAYGRLTGFAPHEVLGRSGLYMPPELIEQPGLVALRAALQAQTEGQAVLRYARKDGSLFWNELKIAPVRDHSGRVTHYIGSQTDVSERIRQQDELARQANYDALTGLPNRGLLEQHLEQMIRQARRSGHLVGVAFIDLDHFKSVNDTIGHGVGDLLLQAAAERFKASIRSCDVVARLGGDEFVVVCPDIHALSDMEEVISRIYTNLRAPLVIGDDEIAVDASIGISGFPNDAASVNDLLKCADMAMYSAKAAGRGNLKFYKAEIGVRVTQRLGIEQELRRALVNQEFVLHYQPKINASTGIICGMEALIRWNHPKHGLVAPAHFIAIAEESKLIIPIGEWVLHEACRQNQAWVVAGLSDFPVSVNVSVGQFKHLDFSETVRRSLQASGMAAALLDLEITETLAMEGPEQFIAMLERIKNLGVSISIDDFGTGYSSLSYIKRFPIDVLKIDRSFVCDILGDADDAAICRTIISMAHNLNLRVVAEGVETLEQTRYLQQHACDELQGYLLCRPEPAAAIEQRLARRGNWLPDEAPARGNAQ
jgi:diguanylate cyclase (GGDEF)-like protein/PAS domain S-box-containing protein